ncbi:recombination regulator RecX [Hydrogenophaga luteola]|uniref:Regulatory protein RecX n=1 Tax=Hydrogenophaga luteola TaxID=1591122 RepID=A0ABV7VWZ8_9BURK
MGFDKTSLKGRALRLLAGREHSRAELEKKLASHEQEPGELQRALDELQAKGFISEQRVVESLIHRRSARLGAGRVKQELQAKGISAEAVTEAVDRLRRTETERAREVWRKKFGETAADPAGRARQMRFLASRGFSAEAIRRVVRGADDD